MTLREEYGSDCSSDDHEYAYRRRSDHHLNHMFGEQFIMIEFDRFLLSLVVRSPEEERKIKLAHLPKLRFEAFSTVLLWQDS